MVIEITMEVLKFLKNKQNGEFEKLISLIKNNLEQSMIQNQNKQNFIYLNSAVSEYIAEYTNEEVFIRYYDDSLSILNPVDNLQRIIITVNEERDVFKVKYDYDKIFNLIYSPVTLLLENKNDDDIYSIIIRDYSDRHLQMNYCEYNGNGNQVSNTLIEHFIEKEKVCFLITDLDEKYPGEENLCSTPYQTRKKLRNLSPMLYGYYILGYKNIEGLYPYRYILDNLKDEKLKNKLKIFSQNAPDKEWLKYFDFKCGFEKNLLGINKTNAIKWWTDYLNNPLLNYLIKFNSNSDEILDVGISNILKNMFKPNKDDFINRSSIEQKMEYNKIIEAVYPWLVANDYALTTKY